MNLCVPPTRAGGVRVRTARAVVSLKLSKEEQALMRRRLVSRHAACSGLLRSLRLELMASGLSPDERHRRLWACLAAHGGDASLEEEAALELDLALHRAAALTEEEGFTAACRYLCRTQVWGSCFPALARDGVRDVMSLALSCDPRRHVTRRRICNI